MEYEIEELIPIVAQLAEKFTSKESTSVSYERARQFMEAVLYCINQCRTEHQLIDNKGISAEAAYQAGYECLIQKIRNTQQAYNEMIGNFHAYENENYYDTVTKAIPGFFQYYDVRFAPQETLITMDYPTMIPIVEESGIDAISKYVEYIAYEQRFLNALPRDYVYEVLYQFQPDYRKQFYNLCSIVLRRILTHMMIGRKLGKPLLKEEHECLKALILKNDKEWLIKKASSLLEKLIREKYNNDKKLKQYLQADLRDFYVELKWLVGLY